MRALARSCCRARSHIRLPGSRGPAPGGDRQLSATATACGISEPQLESLARRTLENSQVQPDAGAGGWLRVRVKVTLPRRNSCTARISARMKAFAKPSRLGKAADSRPALKPSGYRPLRQDQRIFGAEGRIFVGDRIGGGVFDQAMPRLAAVMTSPGCCSQPGRPTRAGNDGLPKLRNVACGSPVRDALLDHCRWRKDPNLSVMCRSIGQVRSSRRSRYRAPRDNEKCRIFASQSNCA